MAVTNRFTKATQPIYRAIGAKRKPCQQVNTLTTALPRAGPNPPPRNRSSEVIIRAVCGISTVALSPHPRHVEHHASLRWIAVNTWTPPTDSLCDPFLHFSLSRLSPCSIAESHIDFDRWSETTRKEETGQEQEIIPTCLRESRSLS